MRLNLDTLFSNGNKPSGELGPGERAELVPAAAGRITLVDAELGDMHRIVAQNPDVKIAGMPKYRIPTAMYPVAETTRPIPDPDGTFLAEAIPYAAADETPAYDPVAEAELAIRQANYEASRDVTAQEFFATEWGMAQPPGQANEEVATDTSLVSPDTIDYDGRGITPEIAQVQYVRALESEAPKADASIEGSLDGASPVDRKQRIEAAMQRVELARQAADSSQEIRV